MLVLITSRFSLVPDETNRDTASAAAPPAGDSEASTQPAPASTGVGSTVTNILQRLWGQSGASGSSNPATPVGENPPAAPMPDSSTVPSTLATNASASSSAAAGNTVDAEPSIPSRSSNTPVLYPPSSGPSPQMINQHIPGSFLSARSGSTPQLSRSHSPVRISPPAPAGSTTRSGHSEQDQSEIDHVQPSQAIPDDYRARHRQREEASKNDHPV
jgi:hypothetical protein